MILIKKRESIGLLDLTKLKEVFIMNIIKTIKGKEGMRALTGVTLEQISDAEIQLGLSFADDYKEYLKEFGMISYGSHELTGIVNSKRLNVVDVTLNERISNPAFPKDMYVIESTDYDGLIYLQKEDGTIFEMRPLSIVRLKYHNLSEYIMSE